MTDRTTIIEAVASSRHVLHLSSAVVLHLGGIILVVAATFDIGALLALSDHPRQFVLATGILCWSAGSLARGAHKDAKRLEGQLADCHETLSQYREVTTARSKATEKTLEETQDD